MKATSVSDTLFILFGAAGDLSWRLVVPAIFNLYLDGHLPQRFKLLAVDRTESVLPTSRRTFTKALRKIHDAENHRRMLGTIS